MGSDCMNVVESGDEDIRSDFAPGLHQILDAADGKVIGKIEETGNGRVPLQCLSCLLITDLRKGKRYSENHGASRTGSADSC